LIGANAISILERALGRGRLLCVEGGGVPKRTYQPKRIPRRRRHGFLRRMSKPGGRNVIRSRRLKGRKRLVTV
jgi:large subunit ribosomal protein L34